MSHSANKTLAAQLAGRAQLYHDTLKHSTAGGYSRTLMACDLLILCGGGTSALHEFNARDALY